MHAVVCRKHRFRSGRMTARRTVKNRKFFGYLTCSHRQRLCIFLGCSEKSCTARWTRLKSCSSSLSLFLNLFCLKKMKMSWFFKNSFAVQILQQKMDILISRMNADEVTAHAVPEDLFAVAGRNILLALKNRKMVDHFGAAGQWTGFHAWRWLRRSCFAGLEWLFCRVTTFSHPAWKCSWLEIG